MKNKHYSIEQINQLSKDPRIKHIDEYSVRFTFEYRLSIYERIKDNICTTSVSHALLDDGFERSFISADTNFCHHVACQMKLRKPKYGKNKKLHEGSIKPDRSYDEYLLRSGKFENSSRGIRFTEQYKQEILRSYPQVAIRDYLANDGFDADRIGYYRIYNLEREFNGKTSGRTVYEDHVITRLKTNVYVKTITRFKFTLTNEFYIEARYFSSMHIDDILEIFEIDHTLLPASIRNRILCQLKNEYEPKIIDEIQTNEQYLRIQRNINRTLTEMADNIYSDIKRDSKNYSCIQRKELVGFITDVHSLEGNQLSITELCAKCGISRSNYYYIKDSESYGSRQKLIQIENDNYTKVIQKIIAYKGHPKGSRMFYMMQDNFGMHISRRKIMKLCREANLTCTVRKENNSSRASKELMERNTKPNLLKRQFKMNRPDRVYLTDVTYIKYAGRTKTAYLSDIKDSVTGKSMGHVLSRDNDLKLVLDTIGQLHKANDGALFHGDQGVLYLNDEFQIRLKKLGYKQSMSKRGNCWDNAPKESQFGHMKDEVDFGSIQDFDNLKIAIDSYYDYYNNERPQWNRNKMTPVEYEKYLNELSDEQFLQYIDIEKRKYDNMIENAARKAIIRASNLKGT